MIHEDDQAAANAEIDILYKQFYEDKSITGVELTKRKRAMLIKYRKFNFINDI
jgi:hypothetical protein